MRRSDDAAMTNETTAPTEVRPWSRPGPLCTALLVMASAGAAAIHFAMVPTHSEESTLLAVGFAVVAWLQAAFAVGVLVRPTRGLLLAGAVLNTLAIGAWVWSRLFGLPFGIGGGEIEAVESIDALCAVLEAVVVGAALWTTRAPSRTRNDRPAMVAAAGLSCVLVIGATSAVLAAPSAHEHGAHGEQTHSLTEAEGASQPHDISHDSGGGHSHVCTAPVTPKEQDAADALVADTRTTLEQWASFDAAVADGFVNITPEGQRVVHYARPAYMRDGNVLDPDAPESLIYAFPKQTSPVLLGAMYLLEGDEAAPTPGGCLTQWHDHTNLCVAPGEGMVGVVDANGQCPAGSSNDTTQAMMHVWRYDTSAGPFAELKDVDPTELRGAVVADLRDA
jgi:hypothetical protein